MQIDVKLVPETPVSLPFSYHDRFAAAVYSALAASNPDFADNLHDGGEHRSRIKLFAFSPLHSQQTEVHRPDPENNIAGGLVFKGPTHFKLASPWPELMNSAGEGLLATGTLRIGSQLLRVTGANLLPPPAFSETMTWRPAKTGSIVTSWSRKTDKRKLYAFPDTPADGQACELLLRTNLVHKWQRLCEVRNDLAATWSGLAPENTRDAFTPGDIAVTFANSANGDAHHYKTRLHHIKKNPVKSWQTRVTITAPPPLQRIAWACGLGEMNSMGFGLVEEVNRS